MKPSQTNQSDYDKAFRKAQAARGLVKVAVWVPTSMRDRLKKYAERLRREVTNRKS